MSYTAQDIIKSSLRLIGVLAAGEDLGANEGTDALNALNDMLDSWSTNNLLIPNKTREVFAVSAGKQAYTMGTSGTTDWNTTRPMWIEQVLVQLQTGQSLIERPVEILTKDEFARILMKQLQITFPLYCYPEGTYPNETINFWPIPSVADNVVIYSAKPLANLSTLTTQLSMPLGYARAIRFNLAMELAPEYGKMVPDLVAEKAAAAIADIKRVNYRPKYLRTDDALKTSRARWDWRIGDTL